MAQTKTVNGIELPASAFLYVPDPEDPSTWKLPVKDANGELNLGRVAAAAAALSPRGFRGQRVDIPDDERGPLKKKLIGLYKRLGRDKTEVPKHLLEQKSAEECPDESCSVSAASIGGKVQNIQEVEYKGRRGLAIEAVMNSLSRDTFNDWALLTPELKASTERYFNDYPVSLVMHGKPYRSLSGDTILAPVRSIMGFTIDHSYEDDGIHIHDFVPEPDLSAPARVQSAYLEIKNGEFDGISVGGFFHRDTGLSEPPGLIIDWDLFEHSYCRNCIDQDAVIKDVTELKSQSDAEAETIWARMNQDSIQEFMASEYAELKATLTEPAPDPVPEPEATTEPIPEPELTAAAAVTTPEPTEDEKEASPDQSPATDATPPAEPAPATDPDPAPAPDQVEPTPVSDPATVEPAAASSPEAVAEPFETKAEPGALSGMDLYKSNHALPTVQPVTSGGPAGGGKSSAALTGRIEVQGLTIPKPQATSGLPIPSRASYSVPGPAPGRIQSDLNLATPLSQVPPAQTILPVHQPEKVVTGSARTPTVSPTKQPISSLVPASEQKANPNPTTTIYQAVDPSPAIPSGGNMNDQVQTSGQSATENNDLLQQLLARVDSMESEKKALELEAENARRDTEARKIAEDRARAVAEQAASAEAEHKAKIEKYTNEALAKYQITPSGSKFTLPVGAGRQNAGSGQRPRYTMAGPVAEEKARTDATGNDMPVNMIDWIFEVKSGQRRANWLSWTEKFGSEAKSVTMGVPGAQTNSPLGSAGGFALPVQYLEEIVPLLIDQFSIRSLISTYPANSILLEVPKMATRATRAVVTAEGDNKPKRQFGTDMLAIRLYTIPQIVDVTNQLLNFSRETAEQIVREQMADAIRLAEFFYALQGTGTNEPFGLIPALVAANTADPTQFFVIQQAAGNQPTGAAVPNTETLPDVIARAINVTQLRFYEPDALLVHPNIWWKLITTKDNYGRYLVDANLSGTINSVWGIRVVHTTQLPMGKAVVGNWKKLRMYIAQDVTVDVTQEAGSRWDQNLTGFRIEEMIGLDARQELNAFTAIDFTTAGVASS